MSFAELDVVAARVCGLWHRRRRPAGPEAGVTIPKGAQELRDVAPEDGRLK